MGMGEFGRMEGGPRPGLVCGVMTTTEPRHPSQSRLTARLIDCVNRYPRPTSTPRGLGRLFLAGSMIAILGLAPPVSAQHRYEQTDLVSDVEGLAPVTDTNLVNPWGLSRSATSFWWTANNGTGTSTLYSGTGAKQPLVVTIPPAAGLPEGSTPTGTVFNSSTDFEVGPGQPARFLFVTQEGTLAGWNPTANATTAITVVDNSNSVEYMGLALAQIDGANHLYAADFHGGKIDVFDRVFAPVDLGAEAFVDPRLPEGYAPFNVQAVGNEIVVAFAKQDDEKLDEVSGAGRGFVTIFSPEGTLLRRLKWGPWFNAPWGIALAPENFGHYSNTLLIGQFGSGKIVAFDPESGRYRGTLRDSRHRPLRIEGLWAIAFGNGGNAGPANTLYFAAGIEDEAHGLFGSITALPDRGNAVNDPDEGEEETDATAPGPDSSTVPDSSVVVPDSSVVVPDSSVTTPSPAVATPDATTTPSQDTPVTMPDSPATTP
jgi:uncharacterized protein (TIGR03118 family)